jgi:FKBP-type peptidyl-prolyl cis-trans isomerase
MKVVIATLLLALAIVAGGCGSSEETSSSPDETTTKAAKTETEPPAKDQSEFEKTPAEEAQLKKEYADLGRWKALKKAAGNKASDLIIPVGPPPDKLLIRELREGHGTKLDKHDQYQLEYLGFDYSSGELVENAWREEGIWWVFGVGEANDTRELGMKGMRVGDVRELVVPTSISHDNDAAVYLFRLSDVFKE